MAERLTTLPLLQSVVVVDATVPADQLAGDHKNNYEANGTAIPVIPDELLLDFDDKLTCAARCWLALVDRCKPRNMAAFAETLTSLARKWVELDDEVGA
jgi:hypothetical protein